jgi:hypothetical protein
MKQINIKNILILIVGLFISINMQAQDYSKWKVDLQKDSIGFHLVIIKDQGQIERIGYGFGSESKVEDYLFINPTTLCIVYEASLHYGYLKLHLKGEIWEHEIRGVLGSNNKSITSAPIPNRDTRPRSYKIIEEDLVLINKGDEELLYDCKDLLLERKAWIEGPEAYRKYIEYVKYKYNSPKD